MSKRFGTRRGQDCTCTERFTCGACLRNAPPYFYTPSVDLDGLDYYRAARDERAADYRKSGE